MLSQTAPDGKSKLFWPAALGILLVLGLFVLTAKPQGQPWSAQSPAPIQSFDAASATPREVEPATAQAVQRDYAHAWLRLAAALEENRAELLDEDFTGSALQQWQQAVGAQRQNGLSRRISSQNHHVQVRFYSPDGSSLEAIDTANLELEYRSGSRILSSEHVTIRYLVLLTPAENSWKIRVLQELAS